MAVKKKVTKVKVLPKEMSKLIEIALADLKKAEKDEKKFIIDMNNWLTPKDPVVCTAQHSDVVIETKETVCVMCLAGSVMAFTLGILKKKNREGQSYEPHTFGGNAKQLLAINALREGEVGNAAHHLLGFEAYNLGLYTEEYREYSKYDTDIPEYDRKKPAPFHKAMTKLQKTLEKAGL